MDKKPASRTEQQNRALHLYCTQVADALNDAGLSIEQVLKNTTMEINWSMGTVKEILWRSAQQRITGKYSTTELNKQDEIDRVYDTINRFLAKLGIESIPWPSHAVGYWETAPLKTEA
jgi:hypothetical protein